MGHLKWDTPQIEWETAGNSWKLAGGGSSQGIAFGIEVHPAFCLRSKVEGRRISPWRCVARQGRGRWDPGRLQHI